MPGTHVSRGQEAFVEPLKGYTVEQSADRPEYVTGQAIDGKKRAQDSVIYGLYEVSTSNAVEAGSTQRIIKKSTHNARKNDVIQFESGLNVGASVQVISCPDADTIIIAATMESSIAIGDTFSIKRYVTPLYGQDGSLQVSSGPTSFKLDSITTEVEEDTVDPTNNIPLPSKIFIDVDGVMLAVKKDTSTPSNSVLLPVEVSGVSGPINITAGDLNVQLSDLGANFDRTRIGDGTNQWGMNASSEGLVHDADSLSELIDINTELDAQSGSLTSIETNVQNNNNELQAINTELDTQTTALGSIDTKLSSQATEAKQDLLLAELQLKADLTETQPVSVASLPLPTGAATEATLLNTYNELATFANESETNQLVQIDYLGSKTETAPASDTASSGLNGRLQRIAQNISALILQLPATLGIKTAANSLSIAPASDAVFKTSPQANQTASFDEDLTVTTTPETFTAPAGAFACFIQADETNTTNIRVKMGATSSPTSGTQFQGGRSEMYEGGSNISYCTESGTGKISVQWFIRS